MIPRVWDKALEEKPSAQSIVSDAAPVASNARNRFILIRINAFSVSSYYKLAADFRKKSGDTFYDGRDKLFNTALYRAPQTGNYRITKLS